MEGARSILLSITGGRDLSLWEVNESAKAVAEAAHPDANIIFGAMVDNKLDDQVWVTVVATGYGRPPRRRLARAPGRAARSTARVAGPLPRIARGPAARTARASRGSAGCRAGETPRRSTSTCRNSSASDAQLRAVRWPARVQLGVIAAGHPRVRRHGADVLRDGGNAVDAAIAAMLASLRLRAAAHRPRRRRLHAGGRSPTAEPVLLDFFVEAPGRGADLALRAELVPISVSFGDAIQVFNIGAASVGAYGLPAGLCEAVARFGVVPLSELVAPAAAARPRRRRAQRRNRLT